MTVASWLRRSGETRRSASLGSPIKDVNLIEASFLSWNIPRTFSSCSSSNYEKYLLNRSPSCLLDKPDYLSVEAPAVCGNGFMERGEQCDCGTVQVNLEDCIRYIGRSKVSVHNGLIS